MDSFSLTSSKEQEKLERKLEMDLQLAQAAAMPDVELITMPAANEYDVVDDLECSKRATNKINVKEALADGAAPSVFGKAKNMLAKQVKASAEHKDKSKAKKVSQQ